MIFNFWRDYFSYLFTSLYKQMASLVNSLIAYLIPTSPLFIGEVDA